MPDLADLFPGFASRWIDTSAGKMFARAGGNGPPLLALHGYPQTHVMWHRVVPALAWHFTVALPDLPSQNTPLEVWRQWASDVRGYALECGHFLCEDNPEATTKALLDFFVSP